MGVLESPEIVTILGKRFRSIHAAIIQNQSLMVTVVLDAWQLWKVRFC